MPKPDDVPQGSNRAGAAAYQGAVEAVLAVVISIAFGYWIDTRLDSSPVGLLVGAVIGFGAMVLRLVRLGRALNPPEPDRTDESKREG